MSKEVRDCGTCYHLDICYQGNNEKWCNTEDHESYLAMSDVEDDEE